MANVHPQIGKEKDVREDTWTVTLPYLVDDVADEDAAALAAIAAAGNMAPGRLTGTTVDERADTGSDAGRIYFVTLTWTYRASAAIAGGGSFSFDTSAATEKVYAALATTETKPADAPDTGGIIRDGVDIYAPSFRWSETHDIDGGNFTNAYVQSLYGATSKVNSSSFRMFDAGEVLLLGVSGSSTVDSEGNVTVPVTFNYAARPNQTNLSIAGQTITSKKGWQFLEVTREPGEDATANREVPALQGVYVRSVYDETDFSVLYP
jgi:hypothetical protein